MKAGAVIKGKTLVIARANIDRHEGIVMVDMLDEDFNRIYYHQNRDGEFILSVYYLDDSFRGYTEAKPETIHDIIDILKVHGIHMILKEESK